MNRQIHWLNLDTRSSQRYLRQELCQHRKRRQTKLDAQDARNSFISGLAPVRKYCASTLIVLFFTQKTLLRSMAMTGPGA